MAVEKYRITDSFDEKGFMIGVGITSARVMTQEELERGEIIGASQDGNREWMSLLAAVCADAAKIPPAYTRESPVI